MGTVVLVTGCAPTFALMANSDGDLQRCEPNAGSVMAWGYVGQQASLNDCVRAYEEAGYWRVSKPPRKKKRRYEPDAAPVAVRREEPVPEPTLLDGGALAPACTAKQRLEMVHAGLSDSAIARACEDKP